MRKLALTTIVAVTFLCCELGARAILDPRGFQSRHEERTAFLARIPFHEAAGKAPGGREASAVERVNGTTFVLHPFFGYTYRPSFAGTNNQGFYSGGPDFPYHGVPGELVVGIFGGSVAMQVADAHEQLVRALEAPARAHGYDRVTVLSFAIGGWRQPQHFNTLVRFIDSIDVAVLVDGFNEVIHLGDWHLQHQPADFPWSAVYAPLARQPSTSETLERADLIRMHEAAARATTAFDLPLLRSSALAHLVWRVYVARYEGRVAALREALGQAAPFREIEPATTPLDIAERRAAYLEWWQDLLVYSDVVSRARGRLFFHFVQPNQYDRGAKPLSPEEREKFTRETAWFDEVTPRYARAEEMTARLRATGVDSTFLGDLFAATEETVYVDDCCHLNARGVAMLATAISDHIVASHAFAGLQPAEVARQPRYVVGPSHTATAAASALPLPNACAAARRGRSYPACRSSIESTRSGWKARGLLAIHYKI